MQTERERWLTSAGPPRAQVTCLAASPSGRYLATGKRSPLGTEARVIVWDLPLRVAAHTLRLHRGRVAALSFSHDETLLASLGGQDDSALVVWDLDTGTALCGAPAHDCSTLAFLNRSPSVFVTGPRAP